MIKFEQQLLPKLTMEKHDGPDGRRVYRTPVGDLPSVTTVLDALTDKRRLKEWRESVGTETAKGIVQQARSRGNAVHQICEQYLLNQEITSDPITLDSFKGIRSILDTYVEAVLGTEMPLYSETLHTAGTCDAIVKAKFANGKNSILDFKTALRTPKEDSDKIKNYKLQATCYAMLVEERYEIEVPYSMIICAVDHDDPAVFSFRNAYYRDIVLSIFGPPVAA